MRGPHPVAQQEYWHDGKVKDAAGRFQLIVSNNTVGRPIDVYDRIAIATIIVYSFFLCGGIYLCFKHGFAKSGGWRSLVVLSLARLIGSSLRLATISDYSKESLYIGWMVLNGLGTGPLITMLLGLLSRMLESIRFNRNGNFIYRPQYHRLLGMTMTVGLILVIVGGTQSNFTIVNNEPKVEYSNVSEAGIAIFVAITGVLCLGILLAGANRSDINHGERRILPAILVCMPFVIVRLVFACLEIYGGVVPTRWMYLGMFVIMEMVVVFICQSLGFNLEKTAPLPQPVQMHTEESGWRHGRFINVPSVRELGREIIHPQKV